jgi:hypothetical protein
MSQGALLAGLHGVGVCCGPTGLPGGAYTGVDLRPPPCSALPPPAVAPSHWRGCGALVWVADAAGQACVHPVAAFYRRLAVCGVLVCAPWPLPGTAASCRALLVSIPTLVCMSFLCISCGRWCRFEPMRGSAAENVGLKWCSAGMPGYYSQPVTLCVMGGIVSGCIPESALVGCWRPPCPLMPTVWCGFKRV